MTRAWRLPDVSARRARDFRASGAEPARARDASTVVLVRDRAAGHGIDVYVQRRQASMAFAGDMVAFPGGGVDPADLVDPAGLADLASGPGGLAAGWAARLGTSPMRACGFVNAAVRELREETGVVLAAGDLLPWAHWITPRFEPRRYDTWFFVAELTGGQEPRDISGEASAAMWVGPAEAIDRADRGEWTLLPPTRAVLEDLTGCGRAADVRTADRAEIPVIMPGWSDDGESVVAVLPGHPRYPGDDTGGDAEARARRCDADE